MASTIEMNAQADIAPGARLGHGTVAAVEGVLTSSNYRFVTGTAVNAVMHETCAKAHGITSGTWLRDPEFDKPNHFQRWRSAT